jgi:hypothetical protein
MLRQISLHQEVSMPSPQAGIVPAPSPNALFLILRVVSPVENAKAVAKIAAGVPALVEKIGSVDPRAKLVCTVSFGAVACCARVRE